MPSPPASSPATGPSAAPSAPARRRGLGVPAFRLACLGLVGFIAWRLATDYWPVPTPRDAAALQARGRLDEATEALEAHLRRHPLDGEARQRLARILAERGEWFACAEQLTRVPAWWPGKRALQFIEGQSYRKVDRSRPAEAAFLGCAAFDPLHPVPWPTVRGAAQELVALYLLEERRESARRVLADALREAKQVAPGDRAAILATGLRLEIERIDPAEAVSKLARHLRADPSDWHSRRALALALEARGDIDAADREVERCLAERPDEPAGWAALFAILRERNDREALVDAVARMPAAVASADDAAIRLAVGLAAETRGDPSAAREALAEAARLDPFDAEVQHRLSGLSARLGDAATAEEARKRHRQLLEARQALPAATTRFRDRWAARGEGSEARESLALVVDDLARLCETLGRADLADELRQLRDAPG